MHPVRSKIIVLSLLALICASSLFTVGLFYYRYEKMARHIAKSFHYDTEAANAIKHATAASDIFSLLRHVTNDDMAEAAVVRLGMINEYGEQLIHTQDGRRDTAREVMKDLHNNYAGIMAAKLADYSEGHEAFPIILAFGHNGTLIINKVYNPFFENIEPADDIVAYSYDWFSRYRQDIDKRIQMKSMRAKDLRSFAKIQISGLSEKKTSHLD